MFFLKDLGQFLLATLCDMKAQSQLLALADEEVGRQQLAEMGWEQRHVILVPVNDAGNRGQGRHWSLLVLLRHGEAQNSSSFSPIWYDSAKSPAHEARAGILARKFLGAGVQLSTGRCALQQNGYDCGIYLCMISEIVLRGFMDSQTWFGFRVASMWQEALMNITPLQAARYRRSLARMYQELLDKEKSSASASVSSSPAPLRDQEKPSASASSSSTTRAPEEDDKYKCSQCGCFVLYNGCINPECPSVMEKPPGNSDLPPKSNQKRQGAKLIFVQG